MEGKTIGAVSEGSVFAEAVRYYSRLVYHPPGVGTLARYDISQCQETRGCPSGAQQPALPVRSPEIRALMAANRRPARPGPHGRRAGAEA
jgi:hypothetical protein